MCIHIYTDVPPCCNPMDYVLSDLGGGTLSAELFWGREGGLAYIFGTHFNVCTYIYIYINIFVHVCQVYIYVYIYIYTRGLTGRLSSMFIFGTLHSIRCM